MGLIDSFKSKKRAPYDANDQATVKVIKDRMKYEQESIEHALRRRGYSPDEIPDVKLAIESSVSSIRKDVYFINDEGDEELLVSFDYTVKGLKNDDTQL